MSIQLDDFSYTKKQKIAGAEAKAVRNEAPFPCKGRWLYCEIVFNKIRCLCEVSFFCEVYDSCH